ncbi:hypothetical protein AGABI1DRAFT_131736 [Agaricus bisporus var. burnettii JB137-S8]|uniref:Uncharacterized protein n=1 Tax=Agaricus bisporus var. burnettii (strain JB137-S8 / ATCC MYA-4627 / FGSC 10392) TaxID=597362 RepID=K5WYW2_AGABU|nr:uncharacterized protein AGABI1DRAFT_131736 [Agaricus bisporus var. burnettii JB137-S8]EKM76018.1 hypothetical protein AGABI1DRAFT_131736 [Agaricus bisporus var. burnettii JB137-S8]
MLDSAPQLLIRRRLFVHLSFFILLEVAFIALAIVCLHKPLPCSITRSSTLTKAIFTTFFIVWQTVAILGAQNVVYHGFSCEWYIRRMKTGMLIPGCTDVVSLTTSSIWDRVRHFSSRKSSLSYRFSFLAFWLLLALTGIAPGSINVEDIQHFEPSFISVTNFTFVGGDVVDVLNNAINRGLLIADLEYQENMTFMFETQPHIIVGWPNIQTGQLTGDIKFQSDALLYNSKCWWEAPSFNTSQWNTTWYAGGFAWYPWITPLPDAVNDGGLMPMYRFTTNQTFLPHDFPDPLRGASPVGFQGYLFFGSNSSLPNVSSSRAKRRRNLNLDGLPTIYNPSGYNFTDFDGSVGHFNSSLATFLLCDPQVHLLDGNVLLSQKNLSISLLSASPPVNEPTIGNISPDAANVALGLGLMEVLDLDDDSQKVRMGNLAATVFTNNTSADYDITSANPFDFGILSLEEIQQNLDMIIATASKAFSSYFENYDSESANELFLVPVHGAVQKDGQALVASRALLIATIALTTCCVVLLVFCFFYLRVWRIPPFKLEAIMNQIERRHDEKIKPQVGGTLRPKRLKRRELVVRISGFILLELAFLFLAFTCTRQPLLIDIPLKSDEVRGGFIVLSILWQALAIFILSDINSFSFSSEWSLQYAKTGSLIPGTTDRVSRVTSGLDDKTRYFFTRLPSITFRLTFVISLMLTALSSLAPGSLSVSNVKVAIDIPMEVADLRLVSASQSDENDNNLSFLEDRAYNVVDLEQHEGSIFKYEMEHNWMMGWPDESSIDSVVVGNVEYPTDVVHFNYSCEWRMPDMGFDDESTTWTIDGQQWELWGDPESIFLYTGGVLPLYRYIDVRPDALFAALFVGTNDSLPVHPAEQNQSIVNLNNLPTLYHPEGLSLNSSDGVPSSWVSPLSTILVCDPRIDISGGRARLTPNKQLSVVASQLPRIGNIPYNAVTTIFSEALMEALDTEDSTSPIKESFTS